MSSEMLTYDHRIVIEIVDEKGTEFLLDLFDDLAQCVDLSTRRVQHARLERIASI